MAKLRTVYVPDFAVPPPSVLPSRETTPDIGSGQALRLVEDPGFITGLVPPLTTWELRCCFDTEIRHSPAGIIGHLTEPGDCEENLVPNNIL
ncbi:MAG: hypothetical protein WD077_04165 [Bacteroidia bacterium]